MKNTFTKKTAGPEDFTEFFFKGERKPSWCINSSRKIEEEKIVQNAMRPTSTDHRTDKSITIHDMTLQGNCKPISLMNTDTKSLIKY